MANEFETSRRSAAVSKVIANAVNLRGWQKSFLSVAILLFGAGSAGQLMGKIESDSPRVVQNQPDNSSGSTLVEKQPDDTRAPKDTEPTLREKLSPWATRVGLSFMGGFIIGFALRTFLRITAMLLALGATLFLGISYFSGKNVDLTDAKTKYEGAIHWAEDQAYKLKDRAETVLPSSGTGLFGAFAGFRRKRRPN